MHQIIYCNHILHFTKIELLWVFLLLVNLYFYFELYLLLQKKICVLLPLQLMCVGILKYLIFMQRGSQFALNIATQHIGWTLLYTLSVCTSIISKVRYSLILQLARPWKEYNMRQNKTHKQWLYEAWTESTSIILLMYIFKLSQIESSPVDCSPDVC